LADLTFAHYFDHNFVHKTPNALVLLFLETRLKELSFDTKKVSFLPALFFMCNRSGFEPYKDNYNKTMLAHEKHLIQDILGSRYQMMKDYVVFFLRILNIV